MEPFTTPRDPNKFSEEIREYLRPKGGHPAPRVHLFTVNGYTYPFVRDLSFACVPDPPETSPGMSKRRFSILAYLYGTRPGDLLFFFQADPQYPKDDVESRRGFRGIYRVVGTSFRDTSMIKHPQTRYEVHGICPKCGKPFATLGEECKICGKSYPEVQVRAIYRNRPPGSTKPFRIHVLSARLLIEPIVVFARTLGDNRAYMDMADPGLIWISRADNAMGAGKGSSIRVLLPEEAMKLARMLASEPNQETLTFTPSPYPSTARSPIENDDGTNAIYPRLHDRWDIVQHELHLNLHLARTIDNPKSSIQKALPGVIAPQDLEYWGSELPWGYTADTADFVCTLRGEGGRYRIVIFEFKRDDINDDALVEVILYVYWVTQVCTQFAEPPISEIEVVPVLIGRQNTLSRVPANFVFKARYLVGPEKLVNVRSPQLIEYEPINIFRNPKSGKRYARDIVYKNVTSGVKQVGFVPPLGVSMTSTERAWIRDEIWLPASSAQARLMNR